MAFIKGDANAARALIGRYSTPLLNNATYILGGDRDMAEDIVQTSFMRLWQNAERLLQSDRELQLRAWLFRVTRNQCLDHFKRPANDELDAAQEISDGSPAALENLALRDRAQYVMALVARLPERQKSALLMAHFEDMSNPEIAEVLECSVEAVENLLARARRSLKSWAQDEELMV